ncbi:MAG: hypothetical protein COB36_02215 [Alphaproteobacteria bacterium]|nr:MAG: hypothetical protein COB36_02215 [Alphaproteobacteria bacterium]
MKAQKPTVNTEISNRSTLGLPLDPAQLLRIESVHRGFLYQHLYATACLLTCGRQQDNIVIVERDEDIELVTQTHRYYLQVKTRSKPLQPGDIMDALERFEELRQAHLENKRSGTPILNIIANVEPGPKLAKQLKSNDWPKDINISTPENSPDGLLPPAWPDINSAIHWCTKAAANVPFGTLPPETLVLKLVAKVQHAAAGAEEHKFEANQLLTLLEQLLTQLQDFPDPPLHYRPQRDEPPLTSESKVRLLTGFSGAGKTAWASQAVLHCPSAAIYYDVGDMPAASVANALARELAARFIGGREQKMGGAIFAESGGIGVLRACATQLKKENLQVTVVLDNVQRMSADSIKEVINAAPNIHFLLLAQPWEGRSVVEARFGIKAETLSGWSQDDIAAEFNQENCPVSVGCAERVLRLTGGLPLYVQSVVSLTVSSYGGNADKLCDAIEARVHTEETAQEIILSDAFETLSKDARKAAGLFSLSDVPLTEEEATSLLSLTLKPPTAVAEVLRKLRRASIVIGFQGNRMGLHDALRPLASNERNGFPEPLEQSALIHLHDILITSLPKERNIPRLNALIRILPRIGRSNVLADLATHEMFHEQGDQRTLRVEIENVTEDVEANINDRYWAHDALAYWESRDGGIPKEERLIEMRRLIEEGGLGKYESLGLCFKELAAAGASQDKKKIERLYRDGKKLVSAQTPEFRILRYNHAIALFRAEAFKKALHLLDPLITEHYHSLGIKEGDMFMKNSKQFYNMLPKPLDHEDLKRLADTLSLWSHARVELNQPPMLRRIHAMKFYGAAQAARSAVEAGLQAIDDFLDIMADPVGAREIMENHVLPYVSEFKLTDMILAVRSMYAIVLAWCGEIEAARKEMKALLEYGGTEEEKEELDKRSQFIETIAAGNVHLERQVPPPNALAAIPGALPFLKKRKIGRNEQCPCGSGQKYKRCHGGR